MKTLKNVSGMGFKPVKQVEITNYLLNNLQQFRLKPTTKLVLLYLSGCYNPNKPDVFPKQKTIAEKMGISEASVIRAISELHKEGLIISERKYTNRYKFTQKLLSDCSKIVFLSDNKMQDENLQKESAKLAICKLHEHEQIKEQIKEQITVEDFKKLKEFAIKKGAKNPSAYAKKIIANGNKENVLSEIQKEEEIKESAKKYIESTYRRIEEFEEEKTKSCPPPQAWYLLKDRLKNKIKL